MQKSSKSYRNIHADHHGGVRLDECGLSGCSVAGRDLEFLCRCGGMNTLFIRSFLLSSLTDVLHASMLDVWRPSVWLFYVDSANPRCPLISGLSPQLHLRLIQSLLRWSP